jgi:hypothetical protein
VRILFAALCLILSNVVRLQVTKIKLEQKQLEGIAEGRSGRRSLVSCYFAHSPLSGHRKAGHPSVAYSAVRACLQGSVLGSGFAGIICAVLALSTGNLALWRVRPAGCARSRRYVGRCSQLVRPRVLRRRASWPALPASLLTQRRARLARSDIERRRTKPGALSGACRVLGLCCVQAYGQTTYLITTLERVPRGTEGAVSLEGTVSGLLAAVFVAGIAVGLQQVHAAAVERLVGRRV